MEKEIIIERKDLPKIIKQFCLDMYTVGFHGIAEYRLEKNTIEDVKNNILDKGLEIRSNRTMLGTVAFNGYNGYTYASDDEFLSRHVYGDVKEYIIVALPKVLINSDGEEIFIGSPTYNSEYDTGYSTGYQLTSFNDALLPESYNNNTSIINPSFILGTFTILPDNKVKVSFNEKHLAFNNNIVSSEYFSRVKAKLQKYLSIYGINSDTINRKCNQEGLLETINYMNEIYSLFMKDPIPNFISEIVKRIEELTGKDKDIAYCFPYIYNETITQMIKLYNTYDDSKLNREGKTI